MTRLAAAALCAGVLSLAGAGSAHAAIGDLTQLTGALGCTHNVNLFGCAPGTSLDQPEQIAVSADGKSAYVASTASDAVAIFDYDPADGSLDQKPNPDGCISPDGSGGTCRTAKALGGPHDLAVSPDGKNVYVGTFDGLAILDRDPATGDLSQQPGGATAGCVTATGSSGTCMPGKGIGTIQGVAVSPDNDNVYVTTFGNDTVATFDRDESTGALSQQTAGNAGCISETGAGPCAEGKSLNEPESVTVSPDGKGVYVTTLVNDGGIAVLDRDPDSGALTQSTANGEGCITETGDGGACVDGKFVETAFGMTFSSDSLHAYVANRVLGIAALDRNATTNELANKPEPNGCLTPVVDATCDDAAMISSLTDVAISPDGLSVYFTTQDFDGVTIFDRHPTTGVLTQKAGRAGCLSSNPDYYDTECGQARAMDEAWDVAVDPADGEGVFVIGKISDTVAVFSRETEAGDPGDGDGDGDGDGGGDGDTGGTGGTGGTDTGAVPPIVAPPPLVTAPLPPRPTPPPRPSRVRRVTVSTRPNNGTVDVNVTTDGAGRIDVSASSQVNTRFLSGARARLAATRSIRVARVRRSVTRAGRFKLVLRPTKKARKVLRRTGRIRARMTIRFTPASGAAASTRRQSVTFRLRRR